MSSARRAKKAVNVSVSSDLLEAARTQNINLSATLESAISAELRLRKKQQWLSVNEESIEAYNQDVGKHGVFGDKLRGF
jgi:antitoxin CcdA